MTCSGCAHLRVTHNTNGPSGTLSVSPVEFLHTVNPHNKMKKEV